MHALWWLLLNRPCGWTFTRGSRLLRRARAVRVLDDGAGTPRFAATDTELGGARGE